MAPDDSAMRRLSKDWDLLIKRLRRELNLTRREFQYFKVTTREGGGVIHAVVRCDLFRAWTYSGVRLYIRQIWTELHDSPNIWFRKCFNSKRLARYVVSQYVAGNDFEHTGHSQNWCFRGFRKKFIELIKKMGYRKAMFIWKQILLSDFEGDNARKTYLRKPLKPRIRFSPELFRNAGNEQLERQSTVGFLDGTAGQLCVDISGITFWTA